MVAKKSKGQSSRGRDAAILRPPAEVLYKDELARLAKDDGDPKPAGWQLSPRAVRDFIIGDERGNDDRGISRKFVGSRAVIERIVVALLGARGLMLIGEPGTAKSMLSELLAAAICGDSTMVLQGSAGMTEEQTRYSWNYALLLAKGPTPESLVPSPLYRAMERGTLLRFEELTRCSQEVQDSLISLLSEKVMHIPELVGEGAALYARPGFNVIATANTRDRGVNDMSAALKRRFNFETIQPIDDVDAEVRLIHEQSRLALEGTAIEVPEPDALLRALVTVFQELRRGQTREGAAFERPSTPMSTAEAVALFCSAVQSAHHFGEGDVAAEHLIGHLAGTAIKDDQDDLQRVRDYFETILRDRAGEDAIWRQLYESRSLLG